jgi:hypothetical protein
MTARIRWFKAFAVSGLAIGLGTADAAAQKEYDVGVTDSEIKIGNVMPYSGPVGIRSDRQNRSHLFQNDQRPGWDQRPENQFHFLRR